jgi:hypothetical protein
MTTGSLLLVPSFLSMAWDDVSELRSQKGFFYPQGKILAWRAMVEWYWQDKIEELGEKPVPVPLCPPQIPHGMTWVRTGASGVRGRRLTAWVMARALIPYYCVLRGKMLFELCYCPFKPLILNSENLYKYTGGHHRARKVSIWRGC